LSQRGILYWKREAATGTEDPAPDGLGHAWVIETDGTERPINDGDPITRGEAARLAAGGDYVFDPEG
jgi:hypothetical protein